MKVHFSLFSSESTRLVRLIKSENPDNQVIIRIYSYPDPFRIADTGYRISRFVCFEDYKHTDIHPLASSFRVGDFCNPHSRPMGTSGSPSYGEIQRFERSRPLYDYPGYRQCIDLY